MKDENKVINADDFILAYHIKGKPHSIMLLLAILEDLIGIPIMILLGKPGDSLIAAVFFALFLVSNLMLWMWGLLEECHEPYEDRHGVCHDYKIK